MTKRRLISRDDAMCLKTEIQRRRLSWRTFAPAQASLAAKLDSPVFEVVPELPPEVVGLGSRVRLHDVRSGEDRTIRLTHRLATFPVPELGEEVCVFSPLGQELLGAAAGDVVRAWVQERPGTFMVEEVLPGDEEPAVASFAEMFV